MSTPPSSINDETSVPTAPTGTPASSLITSNAGEADGSKTGEASRAYLFSSDSSCSPRTIPLLLLSNSWLCSFLTFLRLLPGTKPRQARRQIEAIIYIPVKLVADLQKRIFFLQENYKSHYDFFNFS